MVIKLHDLIGNHSGTHYYLDTLAKKIRRYDLKVDIKSNYVIDGRESFYPKIFHFNPVKKMVFLLYCYLKFFVCALRTKKKELIIVSIYGASIDIGLLLISILFKKKVVLDVHEFVNNSYDIGLRKIFILAFRLSQNPIIIHSKAIERELLKIGNKSKIIFTPHVNYEIDNLFNAEKVNKEVKNSILKESCNFLFFGNIIESKGILDLISILQENNFDEMNVNFIVSGKDSGGIFSDLNNLKTNVKLILRHINDDEMKFLFSTVDFILLPYLEINQSGVMEMAFNYRKPVISSDINYFRKIFRKYSSFGQVINTRNPLEFSNFIISASNNSNREKYFNAKDLNNYYDNGSFDVFINDIKHLFS